MADQPRVLWREGSWQCNYRPPVVGHGRLELYFGPTLISVEMTPSGAVAEHRGEVRQRVVRGRFITA